MYQYTIQADNVQDLSKWGPILLAADEETARPAGRELGPAEWRSG